MKKTAIALICFILLSCNKNEYYPTVNDQEFSLEENASTGTIVGTIEASDPDEGQIISFEILNGNSNNVFQINPTDGVLSVANSDKLNYEENTEYTLTIVVSDNHVDDPKESTSTVKISIIDINEFEPVISGNTTFTINENQETGFEIGQITATDGDIHQNLIYSISPISDSGFVMINPSSGIISVKDSSAIDYETRQKISFEVEVNDGHEPAKYTVATICIDILDVLEITDGLAAYYPFTGNAFDESENENHGTVQGPVLVEDRKGNTNSAYYFDGVNDVIIVPDNSTLSFPEQKVSVSVWIKPQDLESSFMLYKGSTTANREYSIAINPYDVANFAIFNSGSGYAAIGCPSTTILEVNKWYHITGTWDGQFLSIYINGVFENKIESDFEIGDFNSNLIIGSYGGDITEYAFHGVMDELYIHDRVLELSEIETLSGINSK